MFEDHKHNVPRGRSKVAIYINIIFNYFRSWYTFHIICPRIKYKGFVRVGKHTVFNKGFFIEIGKNVQFGPYCHVAADVRLGDNILMGGHVYFVGKCDHIFDVPGQLIWDGDRQNCGTTIIEDDVWIGYNSIILSGVHIGRGSIVAAGSVVTKDVPSCEIWGGNPARKLRDRFDNVDKKKQHLEYLQLLFEK